MNKACESLAYKFNKEIEDRELFVKNLGWLLSQTRNNIVECNYIADTERVEVVFENGYKKSVNVAMDSYIAIVRDIAREVD